MLEPSETCVCSSRLSQPASVRYVSRPAGVRPAFGFLTAHGFCPLTSVNLPSHSQSMCSHVSLARLCQLEHFRQAPVAL